MMRLARGSDGSSLWPGEEYKAEWDRDIGPIVIAGSGIRIPVTYNHVRFIPDRSDRMPTLPVTPRE